MNDPFARFAGLVARFRWIVLLLWIAIMPISGALGASKAAGVLRGGGFVAPGSDSDKAAAALGDEFGGNNASNAIVVFRSTTLTADDPTFKGEATAAIERLKKLEGVRAVVDYYSTNSPSLISADRRTVLTVVTLDEDEYLAQKRVEDVRDELEGMKIDHDVTGLPAISQDLEHTSESDLKRAELFTIPIILVLLLLVFRTIVSAAIPLILGACSVVTAIALLYVIGSNTTVSIFALNVASMLGLGLGIDFSLIIVSRYRDELAAGHDPRDALMLTMATAGRSITYSAITVILSMLILFAMLNLMLVRSLALAVLLVATTGLLGALTLLPALLAILGRKIEWLPILPRPKRRAPGEQGMWYRFSHAIMRRPWLWFGFSLLLLIACAVPIKDIKVVGATPGVLPSTTDSVEGSNALTAAFGGNRLNPISIVIDTGSQNGVWKPEALEAIGKLTADLAADPRVEEVSSITNLVPSLTPEQIRGLTPDFFTRDPVLAGAATQYVNLKTRSDLAVVNIVARTDEYDKAHQDLVSAARKTIIPGVRQLGVYDVYVGGGSAEFTDLRDKLYGRFPYVVLVVMALIYFILLMFFQSVVLPLKAILMNLASIVATYGFLVVVFGYGAGGPVLGFDPIGALNVTTPVILFVILLGLSTDYEVFMLSRVKEYYHETHNNEEAVAAGLESTARVITAAGLILLGTFGSFSLARVVVIKEFGVGLAFGVLLDSTIIRVIMVPATMRLMGNANWWMPAWLKKIVPELREGPAPSLPVATELAAVAPVAVQPVQQQWVQQSNAPQLPPLYPEPTAQQERASQPTLVPLRDTSQPPALAPLYPSAEQQAQEQTRFVAPPVQPPIQPSIQPVPSGPPQVRPVRAGYLLPLAGSVGVERVTLPQSRPFRIGRDREAEMWLFDDRISRQHARIDYLNRPSGFVVTDLGSRNGVYVNDRRIDAPTLLQPGDRVAFGAQSNAVFRFEAE
ncbi:MAG: MMPL family transporter [Thermomicrobiales bacterium]